MGALCRRTFALLKRKLFINNLEIKKL